MHDRSAPVGCDRLHTRPGGAAALPWLVVHGWAFERAPFALRSGGEHHDAFEVNGEVVHEVVSDGLYEGVAEGAVDELLERGWVDGELSGMAIGGEGGECVVDDGFANGR